MGDSAADFTDWQRESRRQALVVDDDFSWSDAPAPRRRGELARPPARGSSGTITIERSGHRDAESGADRERSGGSRRSGGERDAEAYRDVDVHRDSGADRGNGAYRDAYAEVDSVRSPDAGASQHRVRRTAADLTVYARHDADVQEYDYPEAVDDDGYTQPLSPSQVYATQATSHAADASSGRRTVVITGYGNRGYETVHQRRRESEVALTRRGFRPDSVAMWAVLLGIALLLGSIAH